jgi:hypothetical protein
MNSSKVVIELPERIFDNFGSILNEYIKINEIIYTNPQAEFVFDFTKCKFSSPLLIGGIASICKQLNDSGRKYEIKINPDNNFDSYLKTIHFPNGFNELTEEGLAEYSDKTYVPIIFFPTSLSTESVQKRMKTISALIDLLKSQLNLKGDLYNAVSYWLDELTQNVVDHSDTDYGLIFAQFFPKKHYLDLCIIDTGNGIFQSYLNSNKFKPKDNTEAINYAVYGKSTKNIAESRGFGISTSRKMLVKGLKGLFLLYSGNDFFIQDIDTENVITIGEKSTQKGCFVALRVPIIDNEQFVFYNYVEK